MKMVMLLQKLKWGNNNIIHEAMAEGKMISSISNSIVNSNNGMDVYDNIDNIKYNNPTYNYMLYVLS